MSRLTAVLSLVGALLALPTLAVAEVLFAEDFETAITSDPNPRYRWEQVVRMPRGERDLFERSSLRRHTGRFAMRLNYQGRNGIGDLCIPLPKRRSWVIVEQSDSADGQTTLKDSEGRDLGALFEEAGIEPAVAFNESCGFERWKVRSIVGTDVYFEGDAPEAAAVGDWEPCGRFRAGDRVRIARLCADGERRVDLNVIENELQDFRKNDIKPGESVFVRLYFLIPSAPIGAVKTPMQKMLRIYFDNGAAVVCDMQGDNGPGSPRSMEVNCQLPGGAKGFSRRGRVKRDVWTYLEVEVRRSSRSGATDGAVRIWLESDGKPVDEFAPTGEYEGLVVGRPGKDDDQFVVMIGNSPTVAAREGSIFFDDLLVSTEFNGQNVRPRPMAPAPIRLD